MRRPRPGFLPLDNPRQLARLASPQQCPSAISPSLRLRKARLSLSPGFPEAEARGEIYSVALAEPGGDHPRGGRGDHPGGSGLLLSRGDHRAAQAHRSSGGRKGSHYRSLAADHGPALGLASFFGLRRIWAGEDRRLFDALRTGLGKRGNGIGIVISTQAETDLHPFSELIDACIAGNAPGAVLQLIAAPMDSDPFDPEVLKAVNPAWGHYLNPTDLLNDLEEAKRSTAFEPAYRRFRLNQRVQSDENARLLDAATWKLGARPIDEAMLRASRALPRSTMLRSMTWRLCLWCSSLTGFTTFCCEFGLRSANWTSAARQEQELFRRWIKEGWLLGVPGPVITTDFVIGEVAKLHRPFNITEFRHDTSRLEEYRYALDKAGLSIPLEKHRQGPFSMAESASYFTEVAYAGKLIHGNHPLLNYAIANAITVTDSAGNVSIHKGKSHSASKLRIDPLISTIMAIRPPLREERKFQLFYIG